MRRSSIIPRSNWQSKVTEQGLIYHTAGGVKYWDESGYYSFTMDQVNEIEAATNELHQLCLQAVQHVIDNNRYDELKIPRHVVPLIEKSWNEEWPALYGRFDLAYDGSSPPKMLEYNADTPTSLLEASVIQWFWMKDKFPSKDQFNSLHDRLVAKWNDLKPYLYNNGHEPPHVHFAHGEDQEDYMTIMYLINTAQEAGIECSNILMKDIGWNNIHHEFRDLEEYPMRNVFKLYPWEWLINESFGKNFSHLPNRAYWMEPPWKMILSNKGILPILWELFPNHPNLLGAWKVQPNTTDQFVKKPLLSREGQNVTIINGNNDFGTSGEYGEEGYIYQAKAYIPNFDGNYPVIGSWVIDQEAGGMGIRESIGLVTDNMSRFIPHIIDG